MSDVENSSIESISSQSTDELSSTFNSFNNDETDEIGGFYGCEPEYTEGELKAILSEAENENSNTSSSECELDSSRLENLHWCRCRNCVIGLTFTIDECKCCKECNILTEKLEGISCITEHEEFKNLILNPTVLELAYITRRRHNNNYKDFTKISNKQYRFTAYYQYTAWTHYFEILGKGKRIVVPSCVVKEIRNTFPEASGKYVGFKQTE